MSEISIDTLKTMLANLDDAKKYQSLRDVMETLPAPDLAAVLRICLQKSSRCCSVCARRIWPQMCSPNWPLRPSRS